MSQPGPVHGALQLHCPSMHSPCALQSVGLHRATIGLLSTVASCSVGASISWTTFAADVSVVDGSAAVVSGVATGAVGAGSARRRRVRVSWNRGRRSSMEGEDDFDFVLSFIKRRSISFPSPLRPRSASEIGLVMSFLFETSIAVVAPMTKSIRVSMVVLIVVK
jgi:hypothetical protein